MAQPQLKRHRSKYSLSGEQMLQRLQRLDLLGALLQDSVWIMADADVADTLDICCFGTNEGASATVPSIANQLSVPDQGWVAIRATLEEAFFAMRELGCLQVVHARAQPAQRLQQQAIAEAQSSTAGEHTKHMTAEELWAAAFQQQADAFAFSCIAYRHFRLKGWVPRSGVLYGTDLVLYRMHPQAAHSEYCVVVLPAGQQCPQLQTWADLQVCIRLVNQVSKVLLLCHIFPPQGQDPVMLASPACIDQLQVLEQVISRWDPDATRC